MCAKAIGNMAVSDCCYSNHVNPGWGNVMAAVT